MAHPEVLDLEIEIFVFDGGCPPSFDHPGDPPEWDIEGWIRDGRARKVKRFDTSNAVDAEIMAAVDDHLEDLAGERDRGEYR